MVEIRLKKYEKIMKNNIILTGMMGAGKTLIGKNLKEHLKNVNFIDIDEYIENSQNLKISQIFEKFGESHFRQLETKAIKEVCKKNNLIISLGGGAFENSENREILNNSGYTIYLKASAQTLFDRIKNEKHRPLLKKGFNENSILEILNKREKNYEKALITIDTTNKTPYNIIEEILKRIAEYDRHN